ncbi:glycosyltransferase family 4 protein [Mammaliicoccus sciuri]|uniref:glycosyltransferase family 4 protein n=1 Tax=Mammaliicoccus sciuri TaxID=1296 RepID=UPI001299DA60|nr:glycosyltransferase family 4 protein [Mammaliicoccus sciuri]MRE71921.1 glycosyltransferase [Mammaliicoccus sciuri]
MNNKKIFQLITVSKSVYLLKGQIEYLRENNIDVQLVSSKGKELKKYPPSIVHKVNMSRDISVIKDIISLLKLIVLFIKEKPHIVNAGTPKAGLLGMIASYVTRRPYRVYTVRGLRLETVTGIKYKILYLMEKVAMYCATDIVAISKSLKDRIIELNLNNNKPITVFGFGSSNGLNLSVFRKDDNKLDSSLMSEIQGQFIVGYVGRVVKDKGIEDLIKAFKLLENRIENVKLLLIGSIEEGNSVNKSDLKFIQENENVIHIDHVENPVKYYNNMDVFIFPTYREGFGNVSIEAQSLGVPVITYDVTGAKDTVLNNKTGFIVEPSDYIEIANKIEKLIKDEKLKKDMSQNGERWAKSHFSNEIIWKDMIKFYEKKFGS